MATIRMKVERLRLDIRTALLLPFQIILRELGVLDAMFRDRLDGIWTVLWLFRAEPGFYIRHS